MQTQPPSNTGANPNDGEEGELSKVQLLERRLAAEIERAREELFSSGCFGCDQGLAVGGGRGHDHHVESESRANDIAKATFAACHDSSPRASRANLSVDINN